MMKRNDLNIPVFVLIFGLSNFILSCTNNAQTSNSGTQKSEISIASTSEPNEWPVFHGSDHQNISTETGLLKTWSEAGPELLWSVEGLGEGYSSVSIADGLIFTAGTFDDHTYIFAYDLSGKLIWKQPNGSSWKVQVSWASAYNGPRGTPTYDNGEVYLLSEGGRLAAWDARTGKEIWFRDMVRDFEAEMPEYGYAESVLIEGNKLFVRPAGKKGFQVCLNKTNGETIWVNNDIPGTNAYNSPVINDIGGYHQLISCSSNCYYGVDTETGKLLWKADFVNQYEVNATDPVVVNDEFVLMSNNGSGCELIRLLSSGTAITTERIWKTELMDNYHGGILYYNGYFYGSGEKRRGWFCLDMVNGDQKWKAPNSQGSLTCADGMLYIYDEKGVMRLVKATPEAYEVAGEFNVPKGGTRPYWAHPVVCGGRLYLRHEDKLFVYNIKG